MDLSQGLLVTHPAMPEGFLEEVGLWSWALGLLGLGKTQGCWGRSKRQETCVEGPGTPLLVRRPPPPPPHSDSHPLKH